jgi:hypothetical protein
LFPTQAEPDAEYRVATTFTVIEPVVVGSFGRVGPMLVVGDGVFRVAAELVELAPEQYVWAITAGNFASLVGLSGMVWHVNPFVPHRVELQMLGRPPSQNPRVLLLVDGQVVQDIPYSALLFPDATPRCSIIRNAPLATFDTEFAEAEIRFADLGSRSIFQQKVSERLVFSAGCERNDHLETLLQARFGLHRIRGTTTGILLEIRRLSCDPRSTITQRDDEAQWYLEVTYPELTPIFLEALGTLSDFVVEFYDNSPTFTPEALAELAATYLVPISVLEMQWSIAVAAELTGPTVTFPTEVTFTVDAVGSFSIGDTVELRNAAATLFETTTIIDIDEGTLTITTEVLSNSFVAGDVVRKTLATT